MSDTAGMSTTSTSATSEMSLSASTTTTDSLLIVYLTKVQAEGFADGFYSGVIFIGFLLSVVWCLYCGCKTRRAWQNLDDQHHQDAAVTEMHQVRAARLGFGSPELQWDVSNARLADNEPGGAPPAPPDPFNDGIAWRK